MYCCVLRKIWKVTFEENIILSKEYIEDVPKGQPKIFFTLNFISLFLHHSIHQLIQLQLIDLIACQLT